MMLNPKMKSIFTLQIKFFMDLKRLFFKKIEFFPPWFDVAILFPSIHVHIMSLLKAKYCVAFKDEIDFTFRIYVFLYIYPNVQFLY